MLAGGSLLLDRWEVPSPGERLVLAWALGAGLLGTLTLLVGLVRFDRGVFVVIDAGVLMAGIRPLARLIRSLIPGIRLEGREIIATPIGMFLASTLILFAVLNLVGAAGPVRDGDALRYHLAVPQRWLRLGVIDAAPGIPFASFPSLIQLTYAHPLAWGRLAAPALLHTCWALMLSLGIYVWARRIWSVQICLLAALVFLSLTDVSAEAKLPRVDLAVALYSWGAAVCWLRWRAGSAHGWLICAGALAGLAAASKYTGLAALAVTGMLVVIDLVRSRFHGDDRRPASGVLIAAGMLALLIAAPWYLKNWLLTGNPIFPFGGSLFGGPLPAEVLAGIAAENAAYAPIERTPLNFLLTPLLLTFDNQRFASGRIGPLWLVILPLWWWRPQRPQWAIAPLAWGVAFGVFWFWTSPLVRFLLPVLALWAPALADGIIGFQGRVWIRRIAVGATVIWLGFAALSSGRVALAQVPFAFGMHAPALGLDMANALDGSYTYADLQRASRINGPLIVFDTAGFYIDRPVVLPGDLGADPLATLNTQYRSSRCQDVYVLIPDTVHMTVDAWVAARVRPWLAQHGADAIYRRGTVRIYRIECVG